MVCDLGWWLVTDDCIRHSDVWKTAAVCLALSRGFFFFLLQQSDFQGTRNEGKHLFTNCVSLQTFGTVLPFSPRCGNKKWLMSLGVRVLAPAPEDGTDPALHPGSAVLTLRATPVPEALLLSSWTGCGRSTFCQKGPTFSVGTEDGGWIMSRAGRWELFCSSALPWPNSCSFLMCLVLM